MGMGEAEPRRTSRQTSGLARAATREHQPSPCFTAILPKVSFFTDLAATPRQPVDQKTSERHTGQESGLHFFAPL